MLNSAFLKRETFNSNVLNIKIFIIYYYRLNQVSTIYLSVIFKILLVCNNFTKLCNKKMDENMENLILTTENLIKIVLSKLGSFQWHML